MQDAICTGTRDKSSVLDDKHALFHIQTGLPSTGRRHRHHLLHDSTCNLSSSVLARYQSANHSVDVVEVDCYHLSFDHVEKL